MNIPELNGENLPGLYQSVDQASLDAQKMYFGGLLTYLILLVTAAFVSFLWPEHTLGAITSAALFLVTLGILVVLRIKRPDDLWYRGRAVAEGLKARAWRWCMRVEPYGNCDNIEAVSRQFIEDLKSILNQNHGLSETLQSDAGINDPISEVMGTIRGLDIGRRLEIYKAQRIDNQAKWYALKSQFNKRRAKLWFWISVFLHSVAIILLFFKIKDPSLNLPIAVIATVASAVLTWLQVKKHNELHSSYSLAAHEIVLIKGESVSVKSEKDLAEFVRNTEAAFLREHTQWVLRKSE